MTVGPGPRRDPVVLMFHRVGVPDGDPWSLAVSMEHLSEQLEAMAARGPAMALRDLVAAARDATAPSGAFAITFDDGYADAVHTAAPILERLGAPATFFVPSGAVGRDGEYWWDELQGLLLEAGRLPRHLRLAVDGRPREWRPGERLEGEQARCYGGWRVEDPPPTPRHEAYRDLWAILHSMPYAERERAMGALRAAAGRGPVQRPSRRTLTADELADLASRELFEIGAHTVTHPSLGRLSPQEQLDEIAGGARALAEVAGRPVRSFAYPFGQPGDRTAETASLVRAAGLDVACTTTGGPLGPRTDPLLVPRVHVTDGSADALLARLGDEGPPVRRAAATAATLCVCTIVARNYLAHARVLAESLARSDGGRRLRVLLTDHELGGSPTDEPFDVIAPHELPIERHALHEMAAMYDAKELATALKPTLLRHLLDAGHDAVLYLDPDILVLDGLDGLAELAAAHDIVLTPHSTEPLPWDGRSPSDQDHLQSGTFNLGFIAVGPGAGPFLDWWAARLRHNCVIAMDRGLYVDQRWIDLVPGYFRHHVLRDPTWNVAYWNAHSRSLRVRDGRLLAGKEPVRLFHFSGLDPARPETLTTHDYGAPQRVTLADDAVLGPLVADYSHRLLVAGHAGCIDTPYGFGRAHDGTPLDRDLRRRYRDHVLGAPALLPDPFDEGDAVAFRRWIAAPAVEIERVERALGAGGRLPAGWIDVPAEGQSCLGADVLVAGWGLSGNGGFSAVEARGPGGLIARAPVDLERPDIAAAFPEVAGAARSGFRFTLPLAALVDGGPVEVGLVAANGGRVLLGSLAGRASATRGATG